MYFSQFIQHNVCRVICNRKTELIVNENWWYFCLNDKVVLLRFYFTKQPTNQPNEFKLEERISTVKNPLLQQKFSVKIFIFFVLTLSFPIIMRQYHFVVSKRKNFWNKKNLKWWWHSICQYYHHHCMVCVRVILLWS